MIGHDNIACDHEAVALAHFFEDCQKQIAPLRASQPTLPMITTASKEMQILRAIVAPGMVGHKRRLLFPAKKSCDRQPRCSHLYKERKDGPATGSASY